jgi:hypothetical protein
MVQNNIIDTQNLSIKKRIISIIRTRQNGKCRFCNLPITANDKILSSGHGRNYYHKHCAETLNII